jgi:hypothetical protein
MNKLYHASLGFGLLALAMFATFWTIGVPFHIGMYLLFVPQYSLLGLAWYREKHPRAAQRL